MGTRSLQNPRLRVMLTATTRNVLDDSTNVDVAHPNLNYNPTLTSGIAANQANRGWQSTSRTLHSGNSEVIDLYDMAGEDVGAGDGLDGAGQAVVFEEIMAIAIVNDNAVTADGQLEIEPDDNDGCQIFGSHTVALESALRGQGLIMKTQLAADGFDITDGSTNRLKFTANGGDVTYSIYILARHDDEESSSSSSSSTSSSSRSSASSSSISTSSSSISATSESSESSVSSVSSTSSTSSSSISTSSASSTSSSPTSLSSVSSSSSSISSSSQT